MRPALIRQRLDKAEASARDRAHRRAGPVGIVWTGDTQELDRAALPEGARVVEDAHVVEVDPPEWRMVERVARGPEDRGDVYDSAGELLGRVVGISGSLVTWCEVDPDPASRRAAS